MYIYKYGKHIEYENIQEAIPNVLIMNISSNPTNFRLRDTARFTMVCVNMAFHQHNYQEDHNYKS
ncbi:hypothetical protein OIU79_002850 [Salix purpurea]|uniref:Uncharacterized protein n=1 Tax=Salix purpurea TaxID=77065 RepID=A0A9Q0ZEJ8_SALPP|nr:hypothetical protein OIU79_002850 [Salix purpurea]